MPWKTYTVIDERKRMIEEYRKGELSVTHLAEYFGVTRPTIYKWVGRYEEGGEDGLLDRSRAPHNPVHKVSQEIQQLIVSLRGKRNGAKKIAVKLAEAVGCDRVPAVSTINEILSRHNLVVPRKRRRRVMGGTKPSQGEHGNNDVWCADYKGHFRARNGERCDPLTISDYASRYLLRCPLVQGLDFECAWPVFQSAFLEYGLPLAIRTDNGPPFASRAVCGLSRLSILLMKLGVEHQRIERGCPEQNGRHERIHLTMLDAIKPPAASRRMQNIALKRWQREYNDERPHEGLGMRTPASVYSPSERSMPKIIPAFDYPQAKYVRKVDAAGKIYWRHCGIFTSEVLRGEYVGLLPLEAHLFAVILGTLDLGVLDIRKLTFTARKR